MRSADEDTTSDGARDPDQDPPGDRGVPRARQALDVGELERALRKAVDGEVRFDSGSPLRRRLLRLSAYAALGVRAVRR